MNLHQLLVVEQEMLKTILDFDYPYSNNSNNYIYRIDMSQGKENPFMKRNPFTKIQRFYSSGYEPKTHGNLLKNASAECLHEKKKYYDDESIKKIENPFMKGENKKFLKNSQKNTCL